MPGSRKEKKSRPEKASDANTDTLWRQPIMLDSLTDEDPLETLYRGREAGGIGPPAYDARPKMQKSTEKAGDLPAEVPDKHVVTEPKTASVRKTREIVETTTSVEGEQKTKAAGRPAMTESELKDLLKIKTDN